MSRTFRYILAFGFACLLLAGGCSLQKVLKTPHPTFYTSMDSQYYDTGFSRKGQDWIAFSDRSHNHIFPTSTSDHQAHTKLCTFLDPFIILKKKGGMYKVTAYKPDFIQNGKVPRSKHLRFTGWIPEEQVLLWRSGIINASTGFMAKVAVVINAKEVMLQPEKYIQQDSAFIYATPDLTHKTGKKIGLGSIVYIYKQAADGQRFLIGTDPHLMPDSLQHTTMGWISRHMLSVWGERFAVKTKNDTLQIVPFYPDSCCNVAASTQKVLKTANSLTQLYPIQNTGDLKCRTKVFRPLFSYAKNRIYNVFGQPIYYNNYLELLDNHSKLNIIFVLDISGYSKPYTAVVKSLLQELQLKFSRSNYFTAVNFGAVVYKQSRYNIEAFHTELHADYNAITHFLDEQQKHVPGKDTTIVQPLDKGINAAANMLVDAQQETNLIVVIGSTASLRQSNMVIHALSRSNARALFFQTQSKMADAYTDFVLLAENAVLESAGNISAKKKATLVDQRTILSVNKYNISAGHNGVYMLDFPQQSMTQGLVVFPKKGDVMEVGILKMALDTLLRQVTVDNKSMDSCLIRFFHSSIGLKRTSLSTAYTRHFEDTKIRIPTDVASAFLNRNTSLLLRESFTVKQDSLPHVVQPGLFLNSLEFEQLREFYSQVYQAVVPKKGKFRKGKAIRTYLRILAEHPYAAKKLKRAKLKRLPMRELIRLSTGFDFFLTETTGMEKTANDWIKDKKIRPEMVYNYFVQFGDIAAKLQIAKQDDSLHIAHKGKVFFWLSAGYIPQLKMGFGL